MIDEGVIKFNHVFAAHTGEIHSDDYVELEKIREVLYKKGLIGCYSDGIGFGNLSLKRDYSEFYAQSSNPQFLISGTQTGNLPHLTGKHYTRVVDFNFQQNQVTVHGPVKASSESLTHASIYQTSSQIECVIHIHNKNIWNALIENNYPAIPKNIPYGTLEMANYAKEEVLNKSSEKLFVMKGHDEGVIFYNSNKQRCLEHVLEICDKFL